MLGDTVVTATPAAAAAVLMAAPLSAASGMLGLSTPCLVEPFCRSSDSECAKKQMPRGHAAPLRHMRVLYLQQRRGAGMQRRQQQRCIMSKQGWSWGACRMFPWASFAVTAVVASCCDLNLTSHRTAQTRSAVMAAAGKHNVTPLHLHTALAGTALFNSPN
jgi:hypothetical protein